MKYRTSVYYYQFIGSLIFMAFIFMDFTKKFIPENTVFAYLSYALKAVAILFLLITLLQKRHKVFLCLLIGFFLLFILGQFACSNHVNIEVLKVFARYMYPLILFYAYNTIPQEYKGQIFQICKWFLLVNSGLIILSFLFQINVFKTYSGHRFGYSGLLNASATSTYVYVFYLLYLVSVIRNKIKLKNAIFIPFIACFLVGTKSVYLALLLAIAYVFFIKIRKYRYVIIPLVSVLMSVVLLKSIAHLGFILEYNPNEFLTSLLSKRDILFKNNTWPYIKNNWGVLNYCFGGYNAPNLRSQMALFDLVLMFGWIGAPAYLVFYKKVYFNFKLHRDECIAFCVIAFITILAGNFFMYTFTQLAFLILKDFMIRLKN